jgi:hypothetical protein
MRDTRDVRATGLQGEESSEIIEIIDDDIDAFSGRSPNVTVDTGGPRWVGPAAAVALVALIGYGVATSASSGAPKAAPAPSTTTARTTTTQPASTTTLPQPLVPYYSADPPREFSVAEAQMYEPDRSFFGPGKYQLWATTGATSSSGSWFSIQTYSGINSGMAPDAYRVETGERSIAVSHSPFGQSVAQFSAPAFGSVAITTFGMSDEDLIRVAGLLLVSRGSISIPDPSLVPGYDLVSSVQPWLAVQGVPIETVIYQSNKTAIGPNGFINLSVAPRSPSNQGGSTLERQTAIRFFLDHTTTFVVDGHVAVAGTVVGQDDYSLASWIAGDHIVTVSGGLTVPDLIAVAQTVHQVSIDEWQGMQFQATKHNADNNLGGFESDSVAVSFGTDGESNPWVIEASMLSFPHDERQIAWKLDKNIGGFNGEFPTSVDDTAKITTVVENRRTYVLADLPRAVAPTARLEITRAGLDPVDITFNDVSPDFDRTLAAYAFSEPTTYTAQIIGEDGTVLASWPRP